MKTLRISTLVPVVLLGALASGFAATPSSLDVAQRATPPAAMQPQQKITTFLWFDDDAEQAIAFYGSIFENSKVVNESRWGAGGPLPAGTLMSATFQLAGQEFIALNGGPQFHFNEAISLLVRCEDQREIDTLWTKLTAGGGQPSMCGWLKDKYGLSWQIVPTKLLTMMQDPDPAKVQRVTHAMLQMQKLDIARLQQAFEGR